MYVYGRLQKETVNEKLSASADTHRCFACTSRSALGWIWCDWRLSLAFVRRRLYLFIRAPHCWVSSPSSSASASASGTAATVLYVSFLSCFRFFPAARARRRTAKANRLLLLGAIATAQEIPFKPWTKLLQRTVNKLQIKTRLTSVRAHITCTKHRPWFDSTLN